MALYREEFIQFLHELEGQFQRIYGELAKSATSIDVVKLLRNYHTIKGEMATYGMTQIAKQMHEIESMLTEDRHEDSPLAAGKVLDILDATQGAQVRFGKYLDDLNTLISVEDRTQNEEVIRVPASKISRLKEFVLQILPEDALEPVHSAIENLIKQPISPMLQKLGTTASDLAEHMHKPVNVVISGGETEVLYYRLEGLFSVMGHLVRNCVDHGIEDRVTRVRAGKSEAGTISIVAASRDKTITLQISDDGRGVDPERIKLTAMEKKLIDPTQAEKLTERQLVDLIFVSGLTTSNEVSDSSGRGAGMDAVKEEVQSLNGEIQIETNKGLGTLFEITIPGAA